LTDEVLVTCKQAEQKYRVGVERSGSVPRSREQNLGRLLSILSAT
jgi:hypothetical protein